MAVQAKMMFLSKVALNWEAVAMMVALAVEIEADKMAVYEHLYFEEREMF